MNLKINVTGNPNRLHLNLRKKKQNNVRADARYGLGSSQGAIPNMNAIKLKRWSRVTVSLPKALRFANTGSASSHQSMRWYALARHTMIVKCIGKCVTLHI